jgi:hypothetical protein
MAWTNAEITRLFQLTGYSVLLRETYPGIQNSILSAQATPNGVQPDNSLETQIRNYMCKIDQIEQQMMVATTASIISQDTNNTQFSPGKSMMINQIEGQRLCDQICNALYIPRNEKYFFATTRTTESAY